MAQMKFLFSINPIKTLNFFKLNIYISLLHHFALINFFHKSLVKPKLKANIRKYWIHECGMDATRFPSRQGCHVWETKGFSCGLKIYFKILILTFQKIPSQISRGLLRIDAIIFLIRLLVFEYTITQMN